MFNLSIILRESAAARPDHDALIDDRGRLTAQQLLDHCGNSWPRTSTRVTSSSAVPADDRDQQGAHAAALIGVAATAP